MAARDPHHPDWKALLHTPVLWGILAIALLVRIAFLVAVSHPDVRDGRFELYGDEESYHAVAQTLATTGRYAREPAGPPTMYRTPGFVVPLAGLYALFGSRPLIGVAFGLACGMGLAMAIGYAAFELFGDRRAAWGALLVAALAPSLVAYSAMIMTDCLASLCAVASLAALIRWHRQPSARALVFAGLWLGWSCLTRPSGLLLLPPTIAWLAWHARRGQWARDLAWFGVPVLLCMAPWAARNYRVVGVPFFGTTVAGGLLWVSNNPVTAGLAPPVLDDSGPSEVPQGQFLGGWADYRYLQPPEEYSGPYASEWEAHQQLRRCALSFLAQHPEAIPRLVGYKLVRLVVGLEPVQPHKWETSGPKTRRNLRTPIGMVERWLVLALGVVGLWTLWRVDGPFAWLALGFVLATIALVLTAYPSARFIMTGTSTVAIAAGALLARPRGEAPAGCPAE